MWEPVNCEQRHHREKGKNHPSKVAMVGELGGTLIRQGWAKAE